MLKVSQVKNANPIPAPFAVERRNQAANGWVRGEAIAYDEARDIFIINHGSYGTTAAYGCDVRKI